MNNINNLNEKSVPEKRLKMPKRKFVIEDVIVADSEKLQPCLVQFSNGVVKDRSKIEAKLYRNVSEKYKHKRSQRILQATNSRLTYTGKNFDDALDKNFQQRNFLGILDKETNKMKLIEISSFLLHPETSTQTSKGVNFLSTMSTDDRKRELVEHFGGRRARSMIKKRDENMFDIDDMSSALTKATEIIKVEGEIEIDDEKISYKEILPPCNKDALLVRDVYKLEDIIPDVQLVLYNDEAVEYLEGNKDSSNLSILFKQTLANAKLSTDEGEAAKLTCIALFTENLIQLLKVKFGNKVAFVGCPKAMETKILETFSEKKRKLRSNLMEDKLTTHIIVLALIANQFHLEWTTLCRSLIIQKERLESLVCVVGAHFNRKNGSVVLKLPLAVFQSRFASRQKKKFRK